MRLNYTLTLILIFVACTNKNKTVGSDFFQKELQQFETRSNIKILENVKKQVIDSLNLYKTRSLRGRKNFLFLSENRQIAIINKGDLKLTKTVQLTKGKGPGEVLAINAFDISSKHIAVLDRQASKVVLLDRSGSFKNEVIIENLYADYMALFNNESFIIFSSSTGKYLFNELDLSGALVNQYEMQNSEKKYHSMKYTGHLQVHDNNIYFLGYGESILKKFDRNGNLLFSRSTIDNWSSEDNYEKYNTGEFYVQRFTDKAQYAFADFTVWSDYLIAIPHHNKDAEYRYLDIYDTNNGDYLGTYKTEGYASEVVADDKYIYTKEILNGDITLKKYLNGISQSIN